MSLLCAVEGLALVRGGRLLFEGLDLTLGAGEAVHVTGANGSGKSSLIRMVAGLLRAERGADRARRRWRWPTRGWRSTANCRWGARSPSGAGRRLGEALAAFDLDRLAEVPVRLAVDRPGASARGWRG